MPFPHEAILGLDFFSALVDAFLQITCGNMYVYCQMILKTKDLLMGKWFLLWGNGFMLYHFHMGKSFFNLLMPFLNLLMPLLKYKSKI